MKNYRIKKEAVPYILEKHATKVYDLETWNRLGIDIKALEEVCPAFLTYGRKTSDISNNLSGWSGEEGGTFEFTIHFPSIKFYEFDKFSKGKITRQLMDRIQNNISRFYEEYLEGDLSDNN